MNIVAPSLRSGQLVPVMVYVHGGSLLYGGANLPIFDAVNLVSLAVSESKPIVCVNFNYRVGLGGFLASKALQEELRAEGHEGCGNFGFTDQQVALQWVQRYIAQFGGDPEQVTLVGESAGGISISNQLLAAQPSTFHRAVCMSGLATSIPAWTLEQHEFLFREVCKHFGIDSEDPKLMNQLRLIDQAELAEATPAIQGVKSGTGNPCLDGWFYAKDPRSIHAAPEWLESYMVGDVYHEGIIFSMNILNETYASVWKTLLEFIKDEAQLKTILDAYDISPEQAQADFLAAVEHMAGDAVFKVPNYATALVNERLRDSGKLFLYNFDQRSQLHNELEGTAYHAYELLYLFGNLSDKMDDSERILAKQFALAWINFIRGESPWEEPSPKWKVWGPHGKMGLMEERDDESVRCYGRMSQILEMDNGQTWKKWLLGVDALVNQRNNMWNRS
jgi:carboxylesterase type B